MKKINPKLSCNIDVIKELVNEGKLDNLDHAKVALLKELGRASYSIPKKSRWCFEANRDERIIRLYA